jgi:hypothetical protein
MTIRELRTRVATLPVTSHHFGHQDRLIAWLDWELRPARGNDAPAPRAVWDDDGMLLLCEGDTVSLHVGCRRGGKWCAFPPPPRHTTEADQAAGGSNESQGEVAPGDGIPLVV